MKFKRYNHPILFLFAIEDTCGITIPNDRFQVYLSRLCFVDYSDEMRYFVPFAITYNSIHNTLQQLYTMLGFIPLFPSECMTTNDVNVISPDPSQSQDIRRNMNNDPRIYLAIDFLQSLQPEFPPDINPQIDMPDETVETVEDILNSYNITNYDTIDNTYITINNVKTLVTQNSLARIPIKYVDWDIVYPHPCNMYNSYHWSSDLSLDSQINSANAISSLGYYIRRANVLYDSKQHICILDNNSSIIDVLA